MVILTGVFYGIKKQPDVLCTYKQRVTFEMYVYPSHLGVKYTHM